MSSNAPFTGTLIEMPDRADRILFVRTVIELTREGEFEYTTRVRPRGSFLLTTLTHAQIEDVRAAIAATREQEAQERPPRPPRPPRVQRPMSAEEKARIVELRAAGVALKDIAREVGRAVSSVHWVASRARQEARPS